MFRNSTIEPIKIACFARWLQEGRYSHVNEPIMLPPVQRTSLWKPAQVLGFWDSLLRGFPVGSFYLQPHPAEDRPDAIARPIAGIYGNSASVPSAAIASRVVGKSFDLLDGQQRARALLTGWYGIGPERRCIWIDLASVPDQDPQNDRHGKIRLAITSANQPYGYSENGEKLTLDQRKSARKRLFEAKSERHWLKTYDEGGSNRELYDHELFDVAWREKEPVQPYVGHNRQPAWAPLHVICQNLLSSRSGNYSVNEISGVPQSALDVFAGVLARVAEADVALIKVDLNNRSDVLPLFERIGAGGTPLSNPERLFSIYKFHEPNIHNLVTKIYVDTGNVMSPVALAVSAIRIANAMRYPTYYGNWEPDVDTFAKEIVSDDALDRAAKKSIKAQLSAVIDHFAISAQLLFGTKVDRHGLLNYRFGDGDQRCDIGLPRAMLANLPERLTHILLFWSTRMLYIATGEGDNDTPARMEAIRDDLLRFVLAFRLCVSNVNKASVRCFELIKDSQDLINIFPKLYDALAEEPYCTRLIRPETFNDCLVRGEGDFWIANEERDRCKKIGEPSLITTWWKSRGEHLLWLQRHYLDRKFITFDPASGGEDDTPFDLDHMMPQADWGRYWSGAWPTQYDRVRNIRHDIGNAIGNFRIIDAPENRSSGDDDPIVKISYIKDPGSKDAVRDMRDMAFCPAHAPTWQAASSIAANIRAADRLWPKERMAAFQHAVECRTSWLYTQFFDQAGFHHWLKPDCEQVKTDTASLST